MTSILDQLDPLGLGEDSRGERCVGRIARTKDPLTGKTVKTSVLHSTLSQSGERDVEGLQEAYFTLGLYKEGAIHPGGGRKAENAVACQEIVFDADLKDYLGRPDHEIWALAQDEIDGYIQSLVQDAQDVFQRAGVPIHRVVYTGYGIAAYVRIAEEDQERLSDISAVHKALISRINTLFGSVLVDPAVSDPSTRFTRIPGSLNAKGAEPRRVRVISSSPGVAELGGFNVEVGHDSCPVLSRTETRTLELSEEQLDDIVLALARGYAEGNRNAVSLGVPAWLAKSGVSCEQAYTIVERVAADDEELDNRLDAVRRTYQRWESGLSVSGYQALLRWLPSSVRDVIATHLDPFGGVTVTVGGTGRSHPEVLIEPAVEERSTYVAAPGSSYYGWFGEYRNLMTPCTSSADIYHLAASLVYAGATLGKRAHLYQAQRHHPNMMAVLVGETGRAKKDTAAKFAREFFDLQDTARGTLMSPKGYDVLFGLSTSEGLLQWMQKTGPNVVLHTSEFNTLINKARRDSSGDLLLTMTKMWDAPEQLDLPTRKDPLSVRDPFFSLLGTVTPHILQRDMKVEDIESGFANRVLWVFGEGKGYIASPPEPDSYEKKRLMAEFLNATEAAIDENHGIFKRDAHAEDLWADWAEYVFDRSYNNDDERFMAERLEGNATRIALLFAATDGTSRITDRHLCAAIDFVETCYQNVRIESRMWGANEQAKIEASILAMLRQKPRTYVEIVRQLSRYGSVILRNSITALREMEMLETKPDGMLYATGGV